MRSARRRQSTTSTQQQARTRKNTGAIPAIPLADLSDRKLLEHAADLTAEFARRAGMPS